jgi:hypothetical protein
VVLGVTAITATAAFGTSLDHLLSHPVLYGQGYDASFSVSPAGSDGVALLDRLERQPGLAAVTVGYAVAATIDGRNVHTLVGQALRGPVVLEATEGHIPAAPGQVALGSATMRQLGVHLGSLVTLGGLGRRAEPARVVGGVVLPAAGGTSSFGTGAVVAISAVPGGRCPPGPAGNTCLVNVVSTAGGSALVRAAPGPAGQRALNGLIAAYPADVNYPPTPTALLDFGQGINFPLVFGVVVAAFGVATLTHLLVVGVTRRRRETGLLKTLGFVRRQVALSVSWQTTTVAAMGLVVGVPLGLAVGRLAWRAFATYLGVQVVPVVDTGVIVALCLATLVVANLLAVVPALMAARTRPMTLLRVE